MKEGAEYYYGMGEASEREKARSLALADLSQKISSGVSTKYLENIVQINDEKLKKYVQKKIEVDSRIDIPGSEFLSEEDESLLPFLYHRYCVIYRIKRAIVEKQKDIFPIATRLLRRECLKGKKINVIYNSEKQVVNVSSNAFSTKDKTPEEVASEIIDVIGDQLLLSSVFAYEIADIPDGIFPWFLNDYLKSFIVGKKYDYVILDSSNDIKEFFNTNTKDILLVFLEDAKDKIHNELSSDLEKSSSFETPFSYDYYKFKFNYRYFEYNGKGEFAMYEHIWEKANEGNICRYKVLYDSLNKINFFATHLKEIWLRRCGEVQHLIGTLDDHGNKHRWWHYEQAKAKLESQDFQIGAS
ncbi:MAG: hypothetical protein ACXQT5_00445, partial [Candidatus Syntropharchaeia archaeon]